MSFMQEFREFAVKGNAVDMAVGLIIGAAFNKVVTSIVNDLVMPPIGLMIGGVEFKHLAYVLKPGNPTAEPPVPDVAIRWGAFVNTVFEFLIIALTVFMVIKMMNRVIKLREKIPLR